jgi:arylsulfatase A-like enzyme
VRAPSRSSLRSAGIALAVLAVFSALGVVARPERDRPAADRRGRPNVVLIVIDTLRPDHLSHYGYPRRTAAGFDRFAAQATRFDEAFSPSSWTAPSAASLHTGTLPARHRLSEYGTGLASELVTLAETLQANGWNTIGHSFNHHVSGKTGFAQGFDEFDDFLGSSQAYPDVSVMVDRVAAWLADEPRGPFFLYLHPMNTHGPYRVPAAARRDLLGYLPGRDFVYYGPVMSGILKDGKSAQRAAVDGRVLQSLVDQYDTAIHYSIAQLGRALALLRDAGLYDDSLIIVTADHGEELFDHGGFSHGYSLHRELVHVPLYVKLPGQTAAAAVGTRVSLVDVMPTVLDVLGLPAPAATDGLSLRPLLSGGGAAAAFADRPIVHEVQWAERCIARAILLGRYKLVELARNYEGRHDETLLYDVTLDPTERHDLAGAHPEILGPLRAQLGTTLAQAAAGAVATPEIVIRKLDRERLKALGYL